MNIDTQQYIPIKKAVEIFGYSRQMILYFAKTGAIRKIKPFGEDYWSLYCADDLEQMTQKKYKDVRRIEI